MRRLAIFFLAAGILALLHASFFTALGHPLSLINLPLVLVVFLAVGLRTGPAVGAAIVSGTVMDAVSAVPFGTYTFALTAVSLVAVLSLSTVLTHLSFISFLGANAGTYLIFHLSVFLTSSFGRLITGDDFLPPGIWIAFISVISALPIQLAVCAAVRLTAGRFRKRQPGLVMLR